MPSVVRIKNVLRQMFFSSAEVMAGGGDRMGGVEVAAKITPDGEPLV